MTVELKVPPVGESITEVVVGPWAKEVGAHVDQDEPVVTLETDKVNVDVYAPVSGVVAKILKKEGETAQVGEIIGYMEAREGASPEPAAADATPAPPDEPASSVASEGPSESSASSASSRLSPSRRRAMREGKPVESPPVSGSAPAAAPSTPAPSAAVAPDRLEEVVPMTPLRKVVASRLVQAQQTGALLTTFNEVDMSAVMSIRKAYKERFLKSHGVKLGFMSFFVKAVVEALKVTPGINAMIRDDEIVYRNYYDIGVAVGGGKGLVVPVLRNAERMSFADVERSIADFAVRAKANRLKLEELQGGTFTISNGGIYGSLLSTPIVNPPQSGILGMHAIQERPVAVDGQVVIRPMMYTALTYDHRLVDGREAVTFLVRIKECLENPERILLEI